MAKKYEVTGLKKHQYRGQSGAMIMKETLSAESPEKAKDKFEKMHLKYDAQTVKELGQASAPAAGKEKADTDGKQSS